MLISKYLQRSAKNIMTGSVSNPKVMEKMSNTNGLRLFSSAQPDFDFSEKINLDDIKLKDP